MAKITESINSNSMLTQNQYNNQLTKLTVALVNSVNESTPPTIITEDINEDYEPVTLSGVGVDSDSNDEPFNDFDSIEFKQKLRDWVLKHQITHRATNDLLEILTAAGIAELPKDCRTLLQTPRTVEIVKMCDGEYWHNDLSQALINTLQNL